MSSILKGVAVAPGIGVGKVVYFDDTPRFIPTRTVEPEEVEGEVRRFRSALRAAEKDLRVLRRQVASTLSPRDAGIFDAHISILKDPGFVNDARELIFLERINVEQALQRVVAKYEKAFEEVADPAFRERAADIRDVGNRVLMVLLKSDQPKKLGREERFIHASIDFLPSRAGDLDREHCAAIITERGGKYSHGAILAKSMGIPAVVGVEDLYSRLPEGESVAVDGSAGLVHVGLSPQEIEAWRAREGQYRAVEATVEKVRRAPAETSDGCTIRIDINIEGLRDLEGTDLQSFDGVGLFRTEFAFMEKKHFPSEEEQFEIYSETLRLARGRTVVFRTLDIGGDKPLDYFRIPEESNPVLGWRGLRITFGMMDLFYTQMRALLRASVGGPTAILLPMVSTVEEVRKAREVMGQIVKDLRSEGVAVPDRVELGAMVEVPAVAMVLPEVLEQVDFVSIGTNDLTQYLLAVDRDNPRVSGFYEPYHPAVIRMLDQIVRICDEKGKSCSICGEIAGDHHLTMPLIGLGFRTLSMTPVLVPRVKLIIGQTSLEECRRVASQALALATVGEVKELLSRQAHDKVDRYLRHRGLDVESPDRG